MAAAASISECLAAIGVGPRWARWRASSVVGQSFPPDGISCGAQFAGLLGVLVVDGEEICGESGSPGRSGRRWVRAVLRLTHSASAVAAAGSKPKQLALDVQRRLAVALELGGLTGEVAFGRKMLVGLDHNATRDAKVGSEDAQGGSDEPRGSRPVRIESWIDVANGCSGTRSLRWSTTSRAELVLDLSTGLDLMDRADSCQGRGVPLMRPDLGRDPQSRRQERI